MLTQFPCQHNLFSLASQNKTALPDIVVPEHDVAVSLMRACEFIHADLSAFFRKWKVTSQQYNVLRVLYVRSDEQGMPSQQIAKNLITRVPDITRLLDRLEKLGFITRARSSEDRRVVLVKLSERGANLVEEIFGPLVQCHRKRLAHMSPEEIDTLNSLLAKMYPSI